MPGAVLGWNRPLFLTVSGKRLWLTGGASPPEKHATLLDRLQQQVSTARMFYTISPQTRSAPSFSRSNAILPPFTAHAFSRALSDLGVIARYVPQGEADGACVVMAEELGGYVIGKDTDFVILASAASDAMRGYAPLDMLEWIDSDPSEEDTADGGSFTTVKGAKKGSMRISRILPPKSYRNPTLVLYTYAPTALCRRLRLPPNLMPLFSSLVGNDYTPVSATELFFPGGTKPSERIERVARILREQQHMRSAAETHGDAAAALVRRAVRKLCCRPYIDERSVDEIVDAIIEATIQYVLPARHECCNVYPFCGDCLTSPSQMSTPAGTPSEPSDAVAAYAAAQRRGMLNLVTHSWLYPSRIYLWSVLEDPAGQSARVSSGAITARKAAYLIIEEALGTLRFPVATSDHLETLRQDHDVCKLLGVDDGEVTPTDEEVAEVPIAPRTVVEYVRQGSSNRISERRMDLPDATVSDTPACLLPVPARLKLYLSHLGVDTPAMNALPPRLQPLAAVVRLCVAHAAEADSHGSRRWTKPEIEAVLRAGIGCLEGGWTQVLETETDGPDDDSDYPLLTNRNSVIVASLSAGFADAQILAQSLLLLPDVAEPALTHTTPYVFFSGVALHSLLSGIEPATTGRNACGWRWSAAWRNGYRDTLAAIIDSLPPDAVSNGHVEKKKEKVKNSKNSRVVNGHGHKGVAVSSTGSRFDLLMMSDM